MRRLLCNSGLVLLLAWAGMSSAELRQGPGPQYWNNFIYTVNMGAGTVSVSDVLTKASLASIPVGTYPFGVAVAPNGAKVYAVYQGETLVETLMSVIDPLTNTVVKTITVGKGPVGVTFTPDGRKAYVANNQDNTVSVIDTATDTVTATIADVPYPFRIAFTPDGSRALVTNYGLMDQSKCANTVTVIDTSTETVLHKIRVGALPGWVAVTPDGSKVYVANQLSKTVSIIHLPSETVTTLTNVGSAPLGVAITPDGRTVLVSSYEEQGKVYLINTATDTVQPTPFSVGQYPAGIAIMSDGGTAYVADEIDSTLAVLNLASRAVTLLPCRDLNPLDIAICSVPPRTVSIDIKPGVFPNSYNLRKRGAVAVALFSSISFDATKYERSTIRFTGARPISIGVKDLNGDGRLDVLFQFDTQDLCLASNATQASLLGRLVDGTAFQGWDSLQQIR